MKTLPLLITVLLGLMLMPLAEAETLQETKFNVSEYLNLDDDTQKNQYFKSDGVPIANLILSVINFAIQIMGSIAVLLMIGAGFMLLLSEGHQQRIDNAKEVMKYAIIGLIVALLSYVLVITILTIFTST